MKIILQFLVFITISVFCHPSSAQPGFLSLDCGGNQTFIDASGIQWIPDDNFINGGTKVALHPVAPGSDQILQYRSQRVFPESLKKCYTIRSLNTTTKYLVRASFSYLYHDNSQIPPVFRLIFDANIWDNISFQNASEHVIVKGMIVMPKLSGIINVCLGRGEMGVPFITTLELRPLSPNMYGLVNQNYSLLSLERSAFGGFLLTGSHIRYPDDPYDRLWPTPSLPTNFRNISTNSYVSEGAVPDKPPSLMMRTAVWCPSPMDLPPRRNIKSGYLYFSMYFAELEKLNDSTIREFDVYLDNNLLYGGLRPKYLKATNVSVLRWYGVTNQISLEFKATNRSARSPLLNGLEIYRRSEMLVEGTLAQDVEGIRQIQQQFKLENFGDGDPCLPVPYSWEWLACNSDISPRITSLNLSSKGLIGNIPSSITLLSALVNIDLSNNNLSGLIPEFLSELRNLKELNLENNNFSGVLPDSLKNVFVRIAGNPFLCYSSQNCPRSKGNGNKVLIIVLPIAGVIAIGFLCFAAVLLRRKTFAEFFLKKIPEKPKEIDTSKCREFTYKEIIEITSGFQKRIGLGGFGSVFYGQLHNGTEVAVKVLSEKSRQGAKEFFIEVALLSRVHHKNLVSLLGYCYQEENHILVYEYMPMGNLQQLLRGSKADEDVLSWESRLDIALNAAQGLEYLHSGCKPPIIHRDVKTTNILLNARMEAKIADFGLSRIGPSSEITHISTDVKGTFGYLDPQYFRTHNLTEKSDVYSFGVVILELISGRPPVLDITGESTSSRESIDIVSWAKSIIYQGNIGGILDTRMREEEMNMKMDAMWKVAELAMMCTQSQSKERPSMNEVVIDLKQAIQMLRGEGEVIGGRHAEGEINMSNELSSVVSPR